jgi:hypothetical protein
LLVDHEAQERKTRKGSGGKGETPREGNPRGPLSSVGKTPIDEKDIRRDQNPEVEIERSTT